MKYLRLLQAASAVGPAPMVPEPATRSAFPLDSSSRVLRAMLITIRMGG